MTLEAVLIPVVSFLIGLYRGYKLGYGRGIIKGGESVKAYYTGEEFAAHMRGRFAQWLSEQKARRSSVVN